MLASQGSSHEETEADDPETAVQWSKVDCLLLLATLHFWRCLEGFEEALDGCALQYAAVPEQETQHVALSNCQEHTSTAAAGTALEVLVSEDKEQVA